MHTKKTTSEFLFGLAVFVGLTPLAFSFSQDGTQRLLETSFKYAVWFGQALSLLLLLSNRHSLSKNQLIGLSVLFTLVPFTFTFSENGVSFLILNNYTSAILSWASASVVLSQILFARQLKENSNR